jgi:signal transduction histidine kinase
VVTVRDGGVGLGEAEAARLFEPFFKPGGLGMGLPIGRSIVDSHAGRLWATVNPDRGVTMHVALPAQD